MVDAGPLLDAAFIAPLGVAYLAVGSRAARRRSDDAATRRAMLAFAAWWLGIAALFLLTAFDRAMSGLASVPPAVHVALAIPSMLALCIGLAGITHYVTFVYSGNERWLIATGSYFGIIFAALVYGVAREPTQAAVFAASVSRLVILTGPFLSGVIVAFLVPVILVCALYFSIYVRLQDPVQRFRVGTTSLAFILWFGSAILAATLGFAEDASWTHFGRAIGVGATALVVLGYWPPRLVRERSLDLERQSKVRTPGQRPRSKWRSSSSSAA